MPAASIDNPLDTARALGEQLARDFRVRGLYLWLLSGGDPRSSRGHGPGLQRQALANYEQPRALRRLIQAWIRKDARS